MAVTGFNHQAFIDLSDLVDAVALKALDAEIRWALATLETTYTGGLHQSTGRGISGEFPSCHDYGNAIRKFTEMERVRYLRLAPELSADTSIQGLLETVPNPVQKKYLKIQYGVYFPWQTYLQVFPSATLSQDRMEAALPQLFAFARTLPMDRIDRMDLLGVDPYQFPITHQDVTPDHPERIEFIHLTPAGNRNLFVLDRETGEKIYAPSNVCTFNNVDYHGVDATNVFTFSFRVEGKFNSEIRQRARIDGA